MENLFSGRYIFPVLIALFFSCSATGTLGQTPAKRDVTCIIAADLHFDFLPETDQYYHVVAMNRVPGHLVMPSGEIIRKIDAVILAGQGLKSSTFTASVMNVEKERKESTFRFIPVLEIMTWIRLQKARPRITRYTCS